ncbi:MAG TPA: porin family protein [Candidatus Kapabacteria bacterium]|nr:porin family protein [Candidatus Kapabacteria bacterium]
MRYLRTTIFGLILSTVPLIAEAQISQYIPPSPTPTLTIGGRLGLGIVNEAAPAYTNFTVSSRAGLLLGGQLDYWFTPMVAISGQVLYDQKGDELDGISPDNGYPETNSFTLGYLEIPILAKVAFGSSSIRPYVFAGPSIGFLLGASDHQTQTQLGYDQTIDVSSNFSGMDLSLLFGAGVSYQLSSGMQLFGDAGYALGLVNVENTAATGVPESLQSRDVRIAAGVLFTLQ